MKKSILLGLLFASLVDAAALNNLYFGLDNMRGFAEVYWWFLADGRVLHGLPKTGLGPEDFESACQNNGGSCGTYAIKDYVLTLVRNGKSERHMIFPVAGDNLNIDGMVYTKGK
jgi:hypothetical protein